MQVDWTQCAVVEAVPGKMAGQPVLRGTRVRPQDLLVNRAEGLAWLSENYSVSPDSIREVFAFYDRSTLARVPAAG